MIRMRFCEMSAVVVGDVPIDAVLLDIIGKQLLAEILIVELLATHLVLDERPRLIHDLSG